MFELLSERDLLTLNLMLSLSIFLTIIFNLADCNGGHNVFPSAKKLLTNTAMAFIFALVIFAVIIKAF